MAKKIVYKGAAHFREVTAGDFKSAGVEQEGFTKTSFPRNVAVEVDDSVAEVLLNDKRFGKFAEAPAEKAEASSDNAEASTESAQESTGTPSTTTTRSSTRTR